MTKGDKLLIVFVIILVILSTLFIRRQVFSSASKYVSIQVNGKEVKQIVFDPKLIGNTVPIQTEFGYNLIEIGDEKVRVIEADCPDKIDVKQGYISRVGETIVCLPNKMVVEIKSLDKDAEIDIMNY